MKSYLKKLGMIFIMFLVAVGIGVIQNGIVASAATVGQQLLQPEDGWTRYDDTDSKILYSGFREIKVPEPTVFNQCYHINYIPGDTSQQIGKTIKFEFYGTKLRILTYMWLSGSGANVNIDGVDCGNYSDYSSNRGGCYIFFEKLDLTKAEHRVVITTIGRIVSSNATLKDFIFDAIDIDGELKPYSDNQPIVASNMTLNKTSDSLQVGQTDNLVATVTPNNATNKNVTWTSSDPTVATVDSNGKVTALKAGTVSITAKTTDGSNLSMACTVTVADVPPVNPTEDRAVLTITMANNIIKTYDLSEDELNAFINWYDSRANGIGHAFYVFENKANAGNISNKDYISYDRIEYFNVQEYKVK
ncbi:Ig domain-containing protein [Clostridium sp. HBUAS56017]|uniref:Ig-like domain-containing protein n=1 Tax=Clostridium sp. HBUAS56017 TaxID=2571128 RepID=UPI0011779B64|nr:Ig domain-containing protein [Clostridium sp. HBUAS56017]